MLQWPIREGLLRFVHLMKVDARRAYELDVTVWAVQSPYSKADPPKLPAILK